VASFGYDGPDAFERKGIRYIRASHANPSSLYVGGGKRSVYQSIRFALALPFHMPSKADLIVANAFPYLHLPFLRAFCNLHGCKLLIDVAEVWDRAQWRRYSGALLGILGNTLANYALGLGDAYIANSSATLKGLESLGINAGKVHVFSPFLDEDFIRSVKAGKRKRQIVYAGRLSDFKRLDKWLDVFSKASSKTAATGLIIGNGPWKGYLRRRIAQMGLSRKVKVVPFYKDKKSLYKALKESSALLQMSEREGLSAIVLESIALGTPVALPSYTTIPEEVKRMCTVADEEELPDILAQLVAHGRGRTAGRGRDLRRYYVKSVNYEFSKIFKELGIG